MFSRGHTVLLYDFKKMYDKIAVHKLLLRNDKKTHRFCRYNFFCVAPLLIILGRPHEQSQLRVERASAVLCSNLAITITAPVVVVTNEFRDKKLIKTSIFRKFQVKIPQALSANLIVL